MKTNEEMAQLLGERVELLQFEFATGKRGVTYPADRIAIYSQEFAAALADARKQALDDAAKVATEDARQCRILASKAGYITRESLSSMADAGERIATGIRALSPSSSAPHNSNSTQSLPKTGEAGEEE